MRAAIFQPISVMYDRQEMVQYALFQQKSYIYVPVFLIKLLMDSDMDSDALLLYLWAGEAAHMT